MAKYDDMSFGKAFAAARKEKGAGKTFSWRGNSYTTNLAEEEKKGKGTMPRSPAPTARPEKLAGDKPPSAPPARPSSTRSEGSRAGGSTADRTAQTSEAKVKAAIESARSAMSSAREMGKVSGRAARGGGYGEDIRPTLKDAIARVDDLTSKAKDDPKTYLDDLRRAITALRSIVKSGGLSRREDKFRGLGADGPMFEGTSRRENSSGTTGSRARAGMAKGGMAKKGYAKGGMIKANCGASMKPNRKAKK